MIRTNELHANYLFAGDLGGLTGLPGGGSVAVAKPAGLVVPGVGLAGLTWIRRHRQPAT